MDNNVQEFCILAAVACLGLIGGYLLWLWLGTVGFSGLLLGYLVGLWLYFAPLPKS